MKSDVLTLILADDNMDDCQLFKEALEHLPVSTLLTQVHYGDHLMQWLMGRADNLPDAVFLDLNMPRKNGFQCLTEIRQHEKLKFIPIFVISTSYEKEITDLLYNNGANYYIRKPNDFAKLKLIIHQALRLLLKFGAEQPSKEKFLLT